MAAELIDVLAVKELILGDISGARVVKPVSVKNYGLMGVSGGKIVFFTGSKWETVTST